MSSTAPCRLVVIEEHHEAFHVWHRARYAGWIAPSGNALVHIDEHSDWDFPRLTRSILSPDASRDESIVFTRDQLHIGNFIWPAIYLDTFDQVLWCKANLVKEHPNNRMFIVATDEHRREFVTGRTPNNYVTIGYGAPHFVDYQMVPLSHVPQVEKPVTVGICLDFFSGWVYPKPVNARIEITAAEAERFLTDPYHFFRLSPGSRPALLEEDGRFLLTFNDYGYEEWARLRVDEAEIARRVDRACELLSRAPLNIRLVTISRSRLSGYTPADQWEFIEERVIAGLSRFLDIEPIALNALP